MFIEQGIAPNNNFWKYIVGSLCFVVASAIGQIPLMLAVLVKSASENKRMPANQYDIFNTLDNNLTLFLILISFVFALLAVFVVNKYFHQQQWLTIITSRKSIDWKRVFWSFAVWAVISVSSTLLLYYSNPQNFKVSFEPIPFLILAAIAIPMIPIQTTCEELIFRGYLLQGFANLSKNRWFPLIMTSILFGGMHLFNPEVEKMGYVILVYYIGTGFFLGIVTLMDEGTELALGFHASNNLVGALLVTTDWTVFQTNSIFKDLAEPSAGFDVLLPVFIIYPLILFLFAKKYRWTNWKQRLVGNIIIHT